MRKNLKKALTMAAAVISATGISPFVEETVAACPYSENYIFASLDDNHVSIKKVMNMDLTPAIKFMAVIAIVAFIIAFIWHKKMKNNPKSDVYGDRQGVYETQKRSAKVISKTTANHPMSVYVQVNYLTFELENGERREFAIRDESTFRSIVENDKGILTYCGKSFISFDRKID